MKIQRVCIIVFAGLAPTVLAGCNSSQALPEDAPLIGPLTLAGEQGKPDYSLTVAVCNRESSELKAKVEVRGDKKELINSISAFTAPTGTYCYYSLGSITEKRQKPVHVRIEWTRGRERGVEKFSVAPKQTDISKLH